MEPSKFEQVIASKYQWDRICVTKAETENIDAATMQRFQIAAIYDAWMSTLWRLVMRVRKNLYDMEVSQIQDSDTTAHSQAYSAYSKAMVVLQEHMYPELKKRAADYTLSMHKGSVHILENGLPQSGHEGFKGTSMRAVPPQNPADKYGFRPVDAEVKEVPTKRPLSELVSSTVQRGMDHVQNILNDAKKRGYITPYKNMVVVDFKPVSATIGVRWWSIGGGEHFMKLPMHILDLTGNDALAEVERALLRGPNA